MIIPVFPGHPADPTQPAIGAQPANSGAQPNSPPPRTDCNGFRLDDPILQEAVRSTFECIFCWLRGLRPCGSGCSRHRLGQRFVSSSNATSVSWASGAPTSAVALDLLTTIRRRCLIRRSFGKSRFAP
ncbi:hypothetical protein C8Q70DRAFT_266652 [Cubamyces menziesii]|nr:hypothetical protein C8Q70DRAFT_266652 [Cubamyces menziesii]